MHGLWNCHACSAQGSCLLRCHIITLGYVQLQQRECIVVLVLQQNVLISCHSSGLSTFTLMLRWPCTVPAILQVSFDDAAIIESQCLDALRWRLGPWFGDAELSGNDEEMWAAAMGGMEYGTDMDCWE